jgi:cytochrome c oxidase subunit IV
MEGAFKTKGEIMEIELAIYFVIVFLGLQGLYRFSKNVSLTMLTIGNILILQYSFINYEWELLILTIMMMIAQLTRVIWGEE